MVGVFSKSSLRATETLAAMPMICATACSEGKPDGSTFPAIVQDGVANHATSAK
jgi:hypothetical protein